MSTIIKAKIRTVAGKGGARKARRSGMVPGIMYGAVEEPLPLSVDFKDFIKLMEKDGETGLIELVFEDEEGKTISKKNAVIRQVDFDPEKDNPLHVDFMAVSMDRKLTLPVSIDLIGEPVGVVISKGIMSQIIYELEIECLPDAIPHSIKVDVSGLDIGNSIHIQDLPELEGVKVLTGKDQTIVTIEAPKAEEVVEEVEEVEKAEPELISKEKEEEVEEKSE